MPDAPVPVNSQITDSVTQANVKVLGEAPAFALAVLYQVLSQTTGITMANATATQGEMQTIGEAVAASAAEKIMSLSSSP